MKSWRHLTIDFPEVYQLINDDNIIINYEIMI